MIPRQRILDQAHALENELNTVSKAVLQRFPLEAYRRDLLAHSTYWKRVLYTQKRKHIFQTITDVYGTTAMALYHKLAFCRFMADSVTRLDNVKLPDSIRSLVEDWFRQILKDCTERRDSYYYYMLRSFVADLRISLLRSFPVGGPWTVNLERIPIEAFARGAWPQKWKYITCLFTETRGVAPFLIIHTAPNRLQGFNETEMQRAYLRIAEFMKQRPSIRGIYRKSWFLDPRVETISPQLGYLRTVPEQHGAHFFITDTTKTDIENALRFSSKRRQMHAQGEYCPQGYAYIWPREAVLKWAQKTAKTSD